MTIDNAIVALAVLVSAVAVCGIVIEIVRLVEERRDADR